MTLKYSLIESALTEENDAYRAKVEDVKGHSLEDIVERISQKGTTVTRTDTLAVINAFFETITEITAQGETVNVNSFYTQFSVGGPFVGATDQFDSHKNEIRLSIHPGSPLKNILKEIAVEKVDSQDLLPHINEVKDSISGSVNENITSNGILDLTGSRLKIEGENPTNGVYLISEDNTLYKATTIVTNKPSNIIVMIPTIPAGTYRLEVRTQFSGSSLLKSPKIGIFHKPLTVV